MPAMASPQLCVSPAATDANRSPPDTASGTVLHGRPSHDSRAAGVPSRPPLSSPQEYGRPSVVTPQVKSEPALMALKASPPATGTGVEEGRVGPPPGPPGLWPPQQSAAPSAATPRLGGAPDLSSQRGRAPCRGGGRALSKDPPLPS